MNRLGLALAIALVFGIAIVGLAVAAPPQHPAALVPAEIAGVPNTALPDVSAASTSPDSSSITLWMSASENGPRIHSVVSTTNRLWAVASFQEARNERYDIVLRDISGIIVKRGGISANGNVTQSVPISVTDFINSYRSVLDPKRVDGADCASDACVMTRSLQEAKLNCQSAPAAPPAWPEPPRPTVQPGHGTPTPDPADPYRPYRLWLDSTLGHTATGRQAMAEITRTHQAFMALPDARENAQIAAKVAEAQAALVGAFNDLGQVEHELSPSSGPPNVVAGCRLVNDAANAAAAANAAWATVEARLTNVTHWRLPPTTARWSGDRFQGCIQYQTDLFQVFGGSPEPAPRLSVRWSVGEPSAPRLIFPGPDLVDRGSEGELGVALPEGAEAIYAQSVTAPGANHQATIIAYVTDRSCIPVDGVQIAFSVFEPPPLLANPHVRDLFAQAHGGPLADAGTVSPELVTIREGLATTVLQAGQDAHNRPAVVGEVSTGAPGPSPSVISATAPFRVIGTADPNFITFLMRQDRLINYAQDETLNFSIQVRDEFGRDVADGSQLDVSIPQSDPAVIAYYRRPANNPPAPEPTPTPELVVIGKGLIMSTDSGMSALPASADPGFRHTGPVVACTGEGYVTLSAVIDGVTANTNDDAGLKTISCRARHTVHLPLVFMKYDLDATERPPLPIETSTPRAAAPRR